VHVFCHYIVLDIHDKYAFMARELKTKTYEGGMIMTMEPGLYFSPVLLDSKPRRAVNLSELEWNEFASAIQIKFKKYVNMGVRIEDDVLVTEKGNSVLSVPVPKEIEAIEDLMNKR